jgi:hypothetical protein
MQVTTELETGLVPRRQFARRRWYHASNLWYYHRPAPLPRLELDQQFYELVDPDIRDLCRTLHERGIGTAPSCSGHFHKKAYFVAVWDELQREADQIRSDGLVVQDCETKANVLFHNPSHQVPWTTFADFREDLRDSQKGGYLGVIFRNDTEGIRDQFAHDDLFESSAAYEAEEPDPEGNWILHTMVDAPTPDALTHQWNEVARHLHQLLHTAHRPAVVPMPGMLHP